MARDDAGLAMVAEAVRTGGGRSPLFHWLRARHDEFSDLVEGSRPSWSKLAAVFAQLGMAGPDGAPLEPETVRHTWWRVRRDVAGNRQRRNGKVAPPALPSPFVAVSAPDPIAELRRQLNERSGRKSDAPVS